MKCLIAFLFAVASPMMVLPDSLTVLPDVTVIDGSGGNSIPHATVVIDGSKIREILNSSQPYKPARGVRVVHVEGKVVMPGLISAHSHLGLVDGVTSKPENYNEANIERQLKQYEQYGVTTVMSLGLNKDLLYQLRAEQRAGKLGGAAILAAGRGIGVPGGVPPMNVGPDQVYRPKTPEEARQDVREMAAHHPDIVKTWVDDNLGKLPKPNFEVEAAVIDEAHKQGLKVAAHVFYLADAEKLVADGVDVLAHSVRDKPVDAKFIRMMRERHMVYVPTLQLEEAFFIYADKPDWIKSPFFLDALQPSLRDMLLSPDFAARIQSDPATVLHRQFLQTAEQNLKKLADAGITIGFGTDSGAMPTRIAGFAEHRELQLMVEAGLSTGQALHCATAGSAAILGLTDTGTVAAGKTADLLVLDGDPSSNIANADKIVAVFRAGKEVKGPK